MSVIRGFLKMFLYSVILVAIGLVMLLATWNQHFGHIYCFNNEQAVCSKSPH